jgi:retron-type reverse transcriptase
MLKAKEPHEPPHPSKRLEISNREALAQLINVPLRRLTYLLYVRDRKAYYHETTIPKRTGGTRTIHAVQEPMKWLQRRTLEALDTVFEPSYYAHGFTKGHSILSNAGYHRRKKVIVKVDIKDFFPSINFGRVQGLFKGPPFFFGESAALTMAHICCLDAPESILPQGGATSPYVANMICRRLDKRLADAGRMLNCDYTRYADDLTFSTNDIRHFSARHLLGVVYRVLEEEGFRPNKEKTKILFPKDRQVVTGIIVNDGFNVNRKYVHSIRAILHNCEKRGIESQIVKAGRYKDSRSSRTRIVDLGKSDFSLDGQKIDVKTGSLIFVKHLLGRIDFVGDVVRHGEQAENPVQFRRVGVHQGLLWRFYQLLRRLGPDFQPVKKTVRRRIKALYPIVYEQLLLDEQERAQRSQAKSDHTNANSTKALLDHFEQVRNNPQKLDDFVSSLAASDARFFALPLSTSRDIAKVKEKLEFPPFSANTVFRFLCSFNDSETGLGQLTHARTDPPTGEKIYQIWQSHVDPVLLQLPWELRDTLEEFKGAIREHINKVGFESPIDVLGTDLGNATQKLKRALRFSRNTTEASSLPELLLEAFNEASGHMDAGRNRQVKFQPKVATTTFPAHVPSVRSAITEIIRSMLKHTSSDVLYAQGQFDSSAKRYRLRIFDSNAEPLAEDPRRTAFHAKTISAIRKLNAICDYHIEAEFENFGRRRINMMTGEIEKLESTDGIGFCHELSFQVPAAK